MSDKNKDYDEFLEAWNRSSSNTQTQRQSVSPKQSARPGRYLSPKRMSAKRRKTRQRRIVVLATAVLAIAILAIVLICKGCSDGKNDLSALSGVWHYDQYTEYEFDGKGNGCMCLDNSNHYEFTYKAEDGTLYLDFALEYVTDCQYTYTIDGDKLTLVGGDGTAEVGKVYELTRVDEK